MKSDEAVLLAILNSTPVVEGEQRDELADPQWLVGLGGRGTRKEREHVVAARAALQDVVRGARPPATLAALLDGVALKPAMTDDGIAWNADVPADRDLAVRAVLTWDALAKGSPGRLRPCANDECQLFLIDHSRTNTARWCSMAVCGNRMKARRHYQRNR
ncbi:CGNR zinc finger domain-containing protein [Asanoa hainanensis]|uniref:CGNR zinc finger domain-containing protein n=1 Tax=Asanoa hainanensis TaxID=560556 RepID=A0A239KDI4_9ACTN|nr:CGNR zinc finger domain-containing protein [Asanoa hainanensis]SNT16201.1 CGNR zinc finger domain-containing protein [Asanoa hainanensis]